MTWPESKAVAGEIWKDLSRRFRPEEIRLILRALSRLHHKPRKDDKDDKDDKGDKTS